MKFKWRLENVEKVIRQLDEWTNATQLRLASALYEEAEKIITASKQLVPVDTGFLRASGFVEQPEFSHGKVSVALGYGGPAAPYAIHIHEGTRPRIETGAPPPPIGPLKEWARRHGLDEGVAYAIRHKIVMEGTAPTKYLEIPFVEAKADLGERIARGMSRRR